MGKTRRFFVMLVLVLAVGGVVVWWGSALAQTTEDVEAKRARLQVELEAEEKAIAAQVLLLKAKQKETATVSGEIELLKKQIAQAEANIKAKKVAISRLEDDIARRQGRINQLSIKIRREQDSLAELLRQSREFDEVTLPEILLADVSFSDFFLNLDQAEFLQKSIHRSLATIRETQAVTAKEKEALEDRKDKELDAKKEIEYQQRLVEKRETEKQTVLAVNRAEEKAYQQVLETRRKRAAQIRAALFALRDTAAIPFGKALELAQAAEKKTSIRPAFLLAVLKQESNLGENVGSCLLASLESGDGVGKNTGTFFEKVMRAPRDTAPFAEIMTDLGRDWQSTPVSCPIGGTKYYSGRGYGGAMGPAQFIPSTWQLFEDRIADLLGKSVVDPWEPADAFMASALYLADLGADAGTYSAERRAACKYYGSGGSSCTYGNQVMDKAEDIQLNMIEPLQNI